MKSSVKSRSYPEEKSAQFKNGQEKATVITTTNHNVGDDFVREGILYLVEKIIGYFDLRLIHKHLPVTVRDNFEWVHKYGVASALAELPRVREEHVSKLIDLLPLNPEQDKILYTDLLIQSGAPVYWCIPGVSGSHMNEWYEPLVKRRYEKVQSTVPLLNIGAGTCQPYHSDGSEFQSDPECTAFIKEFFSLCNVTTLRDTLSRDVLGSLGLDAPVIPDPSIFARERLGIETKDPQYVALNFMSLGGHFEFGQDLDVEKWKREFVSFYHSISEKHPVRIVCHNKKERDEVKRILPGADYFYERSQTAGGYLKFYSEAKFYIGCRVHGAYATASFGRPAFVIGTDTRAKMMREIGLENAFVNEVDKDMLMDVSYRLESHASTYKSVFDSIKSEALGKYQDAIGSIA